MGLLSDLKREAERVRSEKDAEEMRGAELERIYRSSLAPRLIEIHRYLNELIESLEIAEWAVEAAYDFPGIGQVGNLRQGNYQLYIDSHQIPKKVRLQCICGANEERKFSVDTSETEELRQVLLANQAFFTDWPKRDGLGNFLSMTFKVKLRVRNELSFEADIPGSLIRVYSHNFEGLTGKEYWFGPAAIDENWLDSLAHYLLRKKNVLGRQEMTDEARENLRRLVERERASRQKEVAAAIREDRNPVTSTGILANLRGRLFKSDKSE